LPDALAVRTAALASFNACSAVTIGVGSPPVVVVSVTLVPLALGELGVVGTTGVIGVVGVLGHPTKFTSYVAELYPDAVNIYL